MAHTPPPYLAGTDCVVRTTDGIEVARCMDGVYQRSFDDAQFIVTACNAHADLLAALEQLLRRAEQLQAEENGPCPSCKQARSAILKAKGTSS